MADPIQPPAPAAPGEVPVLTPDGQLGTVPAANAQAASAAGYRVITDPGELEHLQQQAQFGDAAGAAKAFGLGAARGLTFGASDQAFRESGALSPEELKGYKEANPLASGAGQAVGVLAPALATGGAAAEAEGALGAARAAEAASGGRSALAALADALPGSMVARVGGAAERAVGQAAGDTLVGRALAGAARGAAEAPFYAAGDLVSEDALGDKPFTAEALLATAGPAALFGAAAGGAFEGSLGLAKAYLPKALGRAGDALDRLAEKTKPGEFVPPARPELPAGVEVPAGPREVAPFTPRDVPDSAAAARQVRQDLAQARHGTEQVVEQFHAEDKPRMVAQLLGDADTAAPAAKTLATDMRARLDAVPAKLEAVSRARQVLDQVDAKLAGATTDAERFLALDSGKAKIDSFMKHGAMLSPEAAEALRPVREAVGVWRSALEDQGVWGPAAKYQADANAQLSRYYRSREALEKVGLFKRALTPEEAEAGKVVVNPKAVASYLKGLASGDPGADRLRELVASYVDNSRGLLSHLEESTYQELPSKVASARALRDDLGQFTGKAEQAAQLATERKQVLAGNIAGAKAADAEKAEAQREYEQLVARAEKEHGLAIRQQNKEYSAQVKAAKSAFKEGQKPGLLGHVAEEIPLVRGVYHLSRKAEVISEVAKRSAELSGRIADGVKGLLSGSTGAATGSAVGVLSSFHFGTPAARGEGRAGAVVRHAQDQAQLMSTSTPAMVDKLTSATPNLGRQAPQTTALVHQGATRALTYLQAQAPKNPLPQTGMPGEEPYRPSLPEVSRYERIARAVHDPASVLEDAQAGRLTPDAVAALKTVYPQIFGRIQMQISQQLAARSTRVPRQARLQLSLLLGAPLDRSLAMLPQLQANAALPDKSEGDQGGRLASGPQFKAAALAATPTSNPGSTP